MQDFFRLLFSVESVYSLIYYFVWVGFLVNLCAFLATLAALSGGREDAKFDLKLINKRVRWIALLGAALAVFWSQH